MTIEEAVDAGVLSAVHAERWPERVAVQDSNSSRTFRELHGNANRLARVILEAGLKPGDGIALMCSNRCEFIESFLASQRTGLRLTPVNWHLSAAEAAHIIGDCEARAIIAEDRFVTGELSDTLSGLDLRLSIGGAANRWQAYNDALAATSGEDLPGPVHGTIMLYTSGTTGRPKGVLRRRPEPVAPSSRDPMRHMIRKRTSSSAAGRPTMPRRYCSTSAGRWPQVSGSSSWTPGTAGACSTSLRANGSHMRIWSRSCSSGCWPCRKLSGTALM